MKITAELLECQRLFQDGYHLAFTDLAFWNDYYYLAFRKGQWHNIEPFGSIIICRCHQDNLLQKKWEFCTEFVMDGDARDPKFFPVQYKGKNIGLGLVFGVYYVRWSDKKSIANAKYDLLSHIAHTRNGTAWSPPVQVYRPNYWLWSIRPHPDPLKDMFFAAAYHFSAPTYGENELAAYHTIHFLHSNSMVNWYGGETIYADAEKYDISEPVLLIEKDLLRCLVRTEDGVMLGTLPKKGIWQWEELGCVIHSPAVLQIKDKWLIAGRSEMIEDSLDKDKRYDKLAKYKIQKYVKYHTDLWALEGNRVRHLLQLPSSGDCAYPGLVYDEKREELLVSYYSQHERDPLPRGLPRPADIFLARVKLGGL